MTSDSDSAPWAGRGVSRWAHYGPVWLWISVGAIVAFGLNPVDLSTNSALLALTAIVACAFIGWRSMRHHDRRLCERCVVSMPLNPADVAARYRIRFAIVHALVVRPIGLSYLALVIGSDLVLLHGPTIERIGWAVIQLSMVYLVVAYSSHRRLQPWCPQCRGGHGERDHSFDRGPAPLDSRS